MFLIRLGHALAHYPYRQPALLLRDQRGVTAIEYAMIAGIMVVALITSVATIGPHLAPTFYTISSEL